MNIERKELLEHALAGYRHQISQMQDKCCQITAELMAPGKSVRLPTNAATTPTLVKKKRTLSAEGRAAIGAAARKRWAKVRRAKKAA